ncbi:SseB family protein [Rubellimicrobium roseum]|uniref:SseB family protein n=1 Tax=Rubellimicrobium roseum TaxID=687525 RepID=A0A5C4N832_9RHOB|nr:SseB family protein [Rubellimicrobium roseum]TNC63739.1 SseB family protein [Rubellimicrobium roseum]
MPETPLARAAKLFLLRPEDDAARLRLYEVLSGAELVLPLQGEAEPGSEDVTPETVEAGGVPHVVAHDSVAAFAGGAPRPTATLSGLALSQMLDGQGVGLALHLEGMADPLLVAPESLDWLARNLAGGPSRVEARPLALHPPKGLPAGLLTALDRRLAQGEGLATAAWLAAVDWSDGSRGHLLAFVGARPGAEEPLAAGINAAVALSGSDGVRLDVTFLDEGDPVLERIARVALRFDMVDPMEPPTGPPRLR